MTAENNAADRYDRAPCGLVTMTRRGEVLDANATFLRWIGLDDLTDAPRFHDFLRTGDRIFWETHLGPLLDMQGEIREIAVELAATDGPRSALLNATSQTPGDPETLIDVAVFPAEDRRSYERELLAAQKAARESEAKSRLLAETLQQSFIPPSLPWIPGLDLGGAYRPAGSGELIGGDFYDAFQLSDDEWMVVVGDVCGKGPNAASLTALTRFALRGAAMETSELSVVLDAVNSTLVLYPARETCTAALGRFRRPGGGAVTIAVSSAGHPMPRLVRPSGDVTQVGGRGTLLGAYESVKQSVEDVTLDPGESLVFFTDGVIEARSGADFFGDARLDALLGELAGKTATEIAMGVADAVVAFQDGSPRDDVALLVMRRVEEP